MSNLSISRSVLQPLNGYNGAAKELRHFIYYKGDVGSCEGEILESPYYAAKRVAAMGSKFEEMSFITIAKGALSNIFVCEEYLVCICVQTRTLHQEMASLLFQESSAMI